VTLNYFSNYDTKSVKCDKEKRGKYSRRRKKGEHKKLR
jgi:hypothetical protein